MAVNVDKIKYIIFRPKGTRIDSDLDLNGIVYKPHFIIK